MSPIQSLKRLWTAGISSVALLCGHVAFASSTTVISTTTFAYTGSNSGKSYSVPSGANCVTIQAWGTLGYVSASYAASSGNNYTITLNKTAGSTTVAGPNGTITITTGTPTAGGSAYSVTTNSNYTNGSGPSSPGTGNSYVGYVTITASSTLYTLSITGSPAGGGTLSGAGTYAPQSTASIQETAYAGYTNAGWGGTSAGSVASPTSASSTIVMNADRTLIAEFTPNVPVFTSSNSNQVLLVGRPYSFQVSATQSPVYTGTGLPSGLTISSTGAISGTPTSAGTWSASIIAANNAVSVEEMGVGAGATAYISSSTIGNNIDVYATDLNLQVNGVATVGFCIDPWDASVEGTVMNYNWETLAAGPKVADGMGTTVAQEIGQLWDQYYTPSISNTNAAGLQIAIWELVSAAITAENPSYTFSLDSSNNYGASAMISWVESNPLAPSASLDALTGSGQDYVTGSSVVPSSSIATATQVLPFTVYAQPVVASKTASIPVNQPYSYNISATQNPTSYAATVLPPGLTLNAATGVVSGTPTTTGTYSGTISATNPGATGNGTLTLTVVPTYTLTINGSPVAGGTTSGAGTYAAGTVVTIIESAASSYRTNGWSGPDQASVTNPSASTTTIVMNANRNITANFVQQVTLTVTSGPGGSTTGGGTFDVGSTVPITETASSGYRTGGWTGGNGSIAAPGSASTTVLLNSSQTVNAAFVQQVTLTVVAGTGGTVTGGGTFDVGTTAPITETANSGYRTNGWTGGGSSVTAPGSASTTVLLNASQTVTASFVQRVTLTVVAGTGGTATGGGTFDVGSTAPITETANSGYRTNGWTGGGSSIASASSASTTVQLNGNLTVNAAFVQQVTLTVVAGTGGTATGGGTFDVGSTVPITETANSGYRTNGWTGGGSSVASPSSASTTVLLNANQTVDAAFVQQVTLTVTAGTGGSATGGGTYDIGSTVPISEAASTGYRTNGWTGAGVGSVASPSSASTTIVMSGNETIAASFVQRVTLTVAAGTGGTATGSGTFDIGSTVPIAETANSGYRTNGWTGGSGSITSPSSASTTVVLTQSETVNAIFTQQVTLTVTAGTGGTATGSGTYDLGSTVPIVETANTGYRTNGWTGGGTAVAAPNSAATTIVLNTNQTVNANFVQQVTLTVTAGTGGTATGGGTYDIGSTASIVETANSGYRTNGWTGGGSSVASPGSAATTVLMNASQSVTANFVQRVTLTVTAGAGGTATGGGTFDLGTTVPITETANTGYRTGGWTGGGGSVASASSAATTVLLNANQSVTANFVQQVVLTVLSGTGGTATGGGTFDIGTTVPITETANSGYRTNGWTGAGAGNVTAPSSASTSIVMSGNETVDASFVQQVTLTVVAGTGGTAGGGGTFDVGTTVPITETANAGYRTNGWTGGNGSVASPSSAATTVLLNANQTVDASFVQQVTLTVVDTTGGTVTGGGTFDLGATVPITETASTGFRTNGWTGGGSSVASPSSAATTVLLNTNQTVTSSFIQQVTLTVLAGTGGTATGGGTFDLGSTVPITETASAGYRTNGWTGGGSSVTSPSSPATTVLLNANQTVDASFVQQVTLTVVAGTGGTVTGGGTFDIGSTEAITETAGAGYRTNGWTGGGGSVASPTSSATTVLLNANETVNASFVQQVTLTIVPATGGTASSGGTFDLGAVVPISETANTGYRTNGWTGPGVGSVVSSASDTTSIVMNANETIDADFVQQVTLTVLAGSGGTATGGGTFDINSTVPITGSPSTGYGFTDWTGSSPASTVAAATLITLTGNESVTANFAPLPPSAVLTAAATAFTGSPFHVSSVATAPADDLTLHSIEWLSPAGVWTVDSVTAAGATDNLAIGISFASTGVWTLRAGASIDGGNTWVYSPNSQVTVTSGISNYTLETMAVPSASVLLWYAPSPVSQKTYEVQHVNP